MTGALDPILEAIREARSAAPQDTRLATVTAVTVNGISVQFDGESTPSARAYRAVGASVAGDRVVMLRVGSTWIVLGPLIRGEMPGALWHLFPLEVISTSVWWRLQNWSTSYTVSSLYSMSPGGTITVAQAGFYDIRAQAMWRNENNSGGVRGASIWVNGTQVTGNYAAPIPGQADYASSNCSTIYFIAAGGTCDFRALQTTGANVTVHGSPWTNFSILRVG